MNNPKYIQKLYGVKPRPNYSHQEVIFYLEVLPLNKRSAILKNN